MKKRGEQVFLLLMLSVACFGLFCLAGCGDNGCELPQLGCESEDDIGTAIGVSIPGCGGCLTSGWGCDSCLWPQSYKFLAGSVEDEAAFAAMDTRYFGTDCVGCGETEQSCYGGIIAQDIQNWGCVYGSTDSSYDGNEHILGCVDGCGGCIATDGEGAMIIYMAEYYIGID